MGNGMIFIIVVVLLVAAFVGGVLVYRNNTKKFGEIDKQIKSLMDKR